MTELFNEAQELQSEGYSLREIAEELGISKSKVHRILKEGQEKDTSQDDDETFLDTSQSVSETSQNGKEMQKDSENTEFEPIEDKKASLKSIRRKEYILKEIIDSLLLEIIDQENFTLDELIELLDLLDERKSIADRFYTQKSVFDDKVNNNASKFLKELIRFLKRPVSKLQSTPFKELKKDRTFNFVESLRVVEYDDEGETDEGEQIAVIAVELFYYYESNELKEKIEDFLEVENLDKVEI